MAGFSVNKPATVPAPEAVFSTSKAELVEAPVIKICPVGVGVTDTVGFGVGVAVGFDVAVGFGVAVGFVVGEGEGVGVGVEVGDGLGTGELLGEPCVTEFKTVHPPVPSGLLPTD